jgi:hypothetical protein
MSGDYKNKIKTALTTLKTLTNQAYEKDPGLGFGMKQVGDTLYVGFRGTLPNIQDVSDDISIYFKGDQGEQVAARLKRLSTTVGESLRKSQAKRVVFGGHSLGGYLAEQTFLVLQKEFPQRQFSAVTINGLKGPNSPTKDNTPPNLLHLGHAGDPVIALTGRNAKVTTYGSFSRPSQAHSLDNFDPDELPYSDPSIEAWGRTTFSKEPMESKTSPPQKKKAAPEKVEEKTPPRGQSTGGDMPPPLEEVPLAKHFMETFYKLARGHESGAHVLDQLHKLNPKATFDFVFNEMSIAEDKRPGRFNAKERVRAFNMMIFLQLLKKYNSRQHKLRFFRQAVQSDGSWTEVFYKARDESKLAPIKNMRSQVNIASQVWDAGLDRPSDINTAPQTYAETAYFLRKYEDYIKEEGHEEETIYEFFAKRHQKFNKKIRESLGARRTKVESKHVKAEPESSAPVKKEEEEGEEEEEEEESEEEESEEEEVPEEEEEKVPEEEFFDLSEDEDAYTDALRWELRDRQDQHTVAAFLRAILPPMGGGGPPPGPNTPQTTKTPQGNPPRGFDVEEVFIGGKALDHLTTDHRGEQEASLAVEFNYVPPNHGLGVLNAIAKGNTTADDIRFNGGLLMPDVRPYLREQREKQGRPQHDPLTLDPYQSMNFRDVHLKALSDQPLPFGVQVYHNSAQAFRDKQYALESPLYYPDRPLKVRRLV